MSVVQLGELMATQTPGLNPAQFQDEEFELWSIPAFDAGHPERLLGSEIGSAKKVVQPGDVLLSRIVPHIRRSWVVSKSEDRLRQIGSGEWIIFRSKRFDPNYLRHFLMSDVFHPKLMQTVAGVGGSLLRARPEGVKEISFYLPPLEEQKRIAAILDQADELRRKRQRALNRLNQLGQAIFIEMFVGGEQPEWPTLLVEQLVDESSGGIRTGPFGSQLLHSEFVDDGVAVLGIDNAVSNQFQWGQRRYITLDKYDALKRYRVYPGDVIITIMGTCGRCAIVPPEIPLAINTKHLCCISLQREACAPEYLHAYFLTHPTALEYLRSKSKGAIMDGLNMGIIKAMPVRLPPLNLQKQFSIRLSEIERQRGSASDACELGDQLFASLQHRAFRGEL
jgi:type I restriction enzyme S subunit